MHGSLCIFVSVNLDSGQLLNFSSIHSVWTCLRRSGGAPLDRAGSLCNSVDLTAGTCYDPHGIIQLYIYLLSMRTYGPCECTVFCHTVGTLGLARNYKAHLHDRSNLCVLAWQKCCYVSLICLSRFQGAVGKLKFCPSLFPQGHVLRCFFGIDFLSLIYIFSVLLVSRLFSKKVVVTTWY